MRNPGQRNPPPLGLVPIGKGSLSELDAFVKSETVRWTKVIEDAGLAGGQ
jgi:hypothetical protein